MMILVVALDGVARADVPTVPTMECALVSTVSDSYNMDGTFIGMDLETVRRKRGTPKNEIHPTVAPRDLLWMYDKDHNIRFVDNAVVFVTGTTLKHGSKIVLSCGARFDTSKFPHATVQHGQETKEGAVDGYTIDTPLPSQRVLILVHKGTIVGLQLFLVDKAP